jgi:hypothetical protein
MIATCHYLYVVMSATSYKLYVTRMHCRSAYCLSFIHIQSLYQHTRCRQIENMRETANQKCDDADRELTYATLS